ncbi:hypothetical protein BDQ12DRAFT_729555 [Crucibulum laeve]|uniref:Uncharacterized protein n=1 Tax=Crucibulum laeve TaxID=68775 RepID=A0A5C3LHR2_9AGAR|nr:hypothetical protein BDQ12DRAFT_729555 [Crucibulum laeve]
MAKTHIAIFESNFDYFVIDTVEGRWVWPAEESISSNLSPREYLTALLRPIADIYNQLHSPKVLKTPMEYIHVDFGESIWGATFTAEEFKIRRVTAPIVLCLPNDLFDSKGKVSSRIEYALSKALEFKPSAPSIIITNFKDIAVFFLPTWFRSEPVLERISTTQPSLALRAISAACLNDALRFGPYINVPSPDVEVGIPEGPPQDPNQPLLADEQRPRKSASIFPLAQTRTEAVLKTRCSSQ